MKARRLLKRLSRVADDSPAAAAYQQLRPKQAAAAGGKVPQGHVPVCVGEEGGPVERFAVRAELLGSPAFAALLRRAAQEYGYGHPGALRIPCPVADFRRLLLRLSAAADGDEYPSSYGC
uniref:Auxin-responsive protein SAUR71 n=1 Tax=Oryza meridionalis TaxID=40149 RepID=A0A0E0CG76_9ORYZ